MSTINTAELRRLLAAATPGEWEVHDDEIITDFDEDESSYISIATVEEDYDEGREFDNALYIAAAHNAMPALLAALDAKDALMAEKDELIARWMKIAHERDAEIERLNRVVIARNGQYTKQAEEIERLRWGADRADQLNRDITAAVPPALQERCDELAADNARLTAELAAMTERATAAEMAMSDIVDGASRCDFCKHNPNTCGTETVYCCGNFEWRGPQPPKTEKGSANAE